MIVTCGTSQIAKEKFSYIEKLIKGSDLGSISESIDKLQKSDDDRGIDDEYIKRVIGEKNQDSGDKTDEEINCDEMVNLLIQCWSIIDSKIGTDFNPFGAEISTLFKMQKSSVFNPAQDEIVLLYSDTKAGAFSAGVLYKLLLKVWDMSPPKVKYERIPKLKEIPIDVSEAEKNVEEALFNSRNDQIENVFVMTGGFKSVIPMLTICAFVNNDDIYYLFEKSRELRKLILPKGKKNTKSGYRILNIISKHEIGTRKINTIEFETGVGDTPPQSREMQP